MEWWGGRKWGRQVKEGKSDTRQEAVSACHCLFPSPRPSQPCSALGRSGWWGWAQAVQQLCPAPGTMGLRWPKFCAVPSTTHVSLPGTVGPYWPTTAGRSLGPTWPPQVPAGPELVAGQVGRVPQTLVSRGTLASVLVATAGDGTGSLQQHLACGSLEGQRVSVSSQESPFPQAPPMPQEPCPAAALAAPAPHTCPQSLGHPGGSRGVAWAGRHQDSPGSCGCRRWAGGPGRGWPPGSRPGWAASGWQDPAPSVPSRPPRTGRRAAPAPRCAARTAGPAPARPSGPRPPAPAPRRPRCSPGTSPASGCSRCSPACPSSPWSERRCPTSGWPRSRCCPGAEAPPPWTAPTRCWAGARRWRPWSPRRWQPRALRCLQGQSTQQLRARLHRAATAFCQVHQGPL